MPRIPTPPPHERARRALLLALAVAAAGGCAPAGPPPLEVDEAAYAETMETFRSDRLEAINGPDGWNTLVGLFWLEPGENRVGSGASATVRLPADRSPDALGTVVLDGDSVRFTAAPGAVVTQEGHPIQTLRLRTDADSAPTVLAHGSLTLRVIRRGERTGLRVKDSEHPARARFAGLHYFPVDTTWRVRAQFRPGADSVEIVNILGMVERQPSPGTLEFGVRGRRYTLRPVLEKGEPRWFVMFKDSTSRRDTYQAGRYVYVSPPDSLGRVLLDFNQAYNPPCAFTAFATCPLPPPENQLALSVTAGEKRPGGH